MNKTQTPDDVAAARLQMITPLLETNLEPSQLVELKKKVAQDNNISYRSVGRYMNAYLTEGFAGLKPKTGYKRTSNTLPDNFPEVIEQPSYLGVNAQVEAFWISSVSLNWKNLLFPALSAEALCSGIFSPKVLGLHR